MAGIYHNATLGLISLSSDGSNWITISDKNLGATEVYNGVDTLSEANSGKLYQWGNNYGFPFVGGITTSSTKVDASNYGPTNYYNSSTFITGDGDWSRVPNDNLWGGITGTVEAMQGPCDSGFHIPTKDEWASVFEILIMDFNFEQNGSTLKTYLKIPICGYRRSSDGAVYQRNVAGYYHTVTIYSSGEASYFLYTATSTATYIETVYHTIGASIRPFKNEAEIPYADEGRTKLYGDDLPPRPEPPVPVKKLKWLMNKGNFYYFDEAPTHASSVILNENSIKLTEAGQTYQLTATVSPDDAVIKKVHWSSSDITIATVTQTGLVTCITPGECTITATCDGVSGTCSVVQDTHITIPGIYWNETDGLISLSGDGSTRYTIADKNLGATTVYNQGDTGKDANYGGLFQWGNNYVFPGTLSSSVPATSSTQVNAGNYGPGNYYSGSTFIIRNENRSSVRNDNLWGGTTGTTEAMQGPCPSGFHVPTKDEWVALCGVLTSTFGLAQNATTMGTYLKMPMTGYRYYYNGSVSDEGASGNYWASNAYNNAAYNLYFSSSTIYPNNTAVRASGYPIRPFKNEAVQPDETWTVLYQPN